MAKSINELTPGRLIALDEALQGMADGWFRYLNDDDAELPDEIPYGIDEIRSLLGLPEYDPEKGVSNF